MNVFNRFHKDEVVIQRQKRERYSALEERRMWYFFVRELRAGNEDAKRKRPVLWKLYERTEVTAKKWTGLESHFRKQMIPKVHQADLTKQDLFLCIRFFRVFLNQKQKVELEKKYRCRIECSRGGEFQHAITGDPNNLTYFPSLDEEDTILVVDDKSLVVGLGRPLDEDDDDVDDEAGDDGTISSSSETNADEHHHVAPPTNGRRARPPPPLIQIDDDSSGAEDQKPPLLLPMRNDRVHNETIRIELGHASADNSLVIDEEHDDEGAGNDGTISSSSSESNAEERQAATAANDHRARSPSQVVQIDNDVVAETTAPTAVVAPPKTPPTGRQPSPKRQRIDHLLLLNSESGQREQRRALSEGHQHTGGKVGSAQMRQQQRENGTPKKSKSAEAEERLKKRFISGSHDVFNQNKSYREFSEEFMFITGDRDYHKFVRGIEWLVDDRDNERLAHSQQQRNRDKQTNSLA